eukprot:5571990-Karenia_brevis.AAC.1
MIVAGHRPMKDEYLRTWGEMCKGDKSVVEFHARRASGEWILIVAKITATLSDPDVLFELGLIESVRADYNTVGFELRDEHVNLRNKTEQFIEYIIGTISTFAWRHVHFST